jgi:hypothetical protein
MSQYPRERIEARLTYVAISNAHRVFAASRMPLTVQPSPSRFCDGTSGHRIRLITFLIGQPQLHTQKARFQMQGDEQIIARFMIEQLQFYGIRNAAEAATCLAFETLRAPFPGKLSAIGAYTDALHPE